MHTDLTGSCHCGSVKFRITGEPVLVCGCSCTDCARSSGSPYVVWVGVHAPMIEFPEELPVVRATSPRTERGHCGECGAALTFRRIGAEAEVDPLFYVTAASLDDPDRVRPSEVVHYGERPDWFDLPDDIPHHPGASPQYGSRKRHGKPN